MTSGQGQDGLWKTPPMYATPSHLALQKLLYVRPFEPQTGLYIFGHKLHGNDCRGIAAESTEVKVKAIISTH